MAGLCWSARMKSPHCAGIHEQSDVKAFIRKLSIRVSRGPGSWLTLVLLLVVLVPSACLLWFANRAAQNERLAFRQRYLEASRSHLLLAGEHLNAAWIQQERHISRQAGQVSPSMLFQTVVTQGMADALVSFDTTGAVVYPTAASPVTGFVEPSEWNAVRMMEDTRPDEAVAAYVKMASNAANADLRALALQGQSRCLVRSGRPADALAVIAGPLSDASLAMATDALGRRVIPNAWMMAVELTGKTHPSQARDWGDRLKSMLEDYTSPMPASQRRFLMRELQNQFPGRMRFDLLPAEELAARWVEENPVRPAGSAALQSARLSGIWQRTAADGRVVLLYSTKSLRDQLKAASVVPGMSAGMSVEILPPGMEMDGVLSVIPAGADFPGWRLALKSPDAAMLDAGANQRMASYAWSGVLMVGIIVVLGLMALGMIRRQMALTQLRNDLVANVTHELKTPLASMRLLVETLVNSEKLDEPTVRDYLGLIEKENLRLSRLIDNFLTFSRIERNKYSFQFKPVPAASLAEGAVSAMRERLQSEGCRFTLELPAGLPRVSADADAMVMALMNLLDNAWKYSGEDKQIHLAVSVADGRVRFAVRDNGIGLSPADRLRVFKRFQQVNPTFRGGGGCGLGLSIVQFVVSAHGGTLTVDSEPGRGSTFAIHLPVSGTHSTQ